MVHVGHGELSYVFVSCWLADRSGQGPVARKRRKREREGVVRATFLLRFVSDSTTCVCVYNANVPIHFPLCHTTVQLYTPRRSPFTKITLCIIL